jgi:hypothetical protein
MLQLKKGKMLHKIDKTGINICFLGISLIAIAYERKYDEFSRIYQFAKHYLYAPSSAMYSCPLSMTGKLIHIFIFILAIYISPFLSIDGAARVIELLGTKEMKDTYYSHLIR